MWACSHGGISPDPEGQSTLRQGRNGQQREKCQHTFHIFPVVEHQGFQQRVPGGFQVFLVAGDQLAAGERILPAKADENFQIPLTHMGQSQQFFAGKQFFIEIQLIQRLKGASVR